jgi:hypothetical protein
MIRDAVTRLVLPISALLLAGVACDSDKNRCGAGAAPCPPPTAGLAVVQGSVVNADGVPIAGRQVYVSCPGVGGYDQRTKSDGTFRITLVYGSFEGPPALDADGMFRLTCSVVAMERLVRDTVTVPFAQTLDAVLPVTVTIREPS